MHARRALLPIVVLVAWFYAHCAHRSPARDPVAEDMPHADHTLAVDDPPDSIEELQRRISKVLASERAAGATIALVGRDGPIWVGGIGLRDVESRAPMQADTVFRVGSLTKSVIALGVMRLADQGKLDVDAPLRELLPGLIENPWEAVAPVTLAQCMEHTAGLDDIRFNEIYADDETFPVADALAINPRSRIVRWRPGTRHAYSNVGYTVAARAIEVASGEPFDVYLRREILAPLGIHDADFGRTPAIRQRLATGYQNGRAQPFHVFAHRPAGSLLISAADLAKFVHFWIVRGEGYPSIVSAAGLARIERNGTLPYPRVDNEYGFANYVDVNHPTLSHGHDGGMPGFHASFRYFSDLGVGYVMLLNSNYTFRGYFEIRSLLYSYLTRDRSRSPSTSVYVERPSASYFALANPRNEFFGFLERALEGWSFSDSPAGVHGRHLGGETFELHATPDGGYRWPNDCGSSVRFTKDLDGNAIVIMSFTYGEAASYWSARLRYLALGFAFLLLKFVPLWAAAVLIADGLFRRRSLPRTLVMPPAIAGLVCFLVPHALDHAFDAGVVGDLHPYTVGIFVLTIVLALASFATLAFTIRWALHAKRPRLVSLIIPALCGVAFSGLSIWLWANGWIGLRTWSW